MTARRRTGEKKTPAVALEELARQAMDVAKKARRHRKSLSGDNYYGNKLAELRTDAASVFSEFYEPSTGDATALAELIEPIFDAASSQENRLRSYRELTFSLRTTFRTPGASLPAGGEGLFPATILAQASRGYLASIGRQMNGCYASGWRDASAVMMRRLLEVAIIEAFEKKDIAGKIKDGNGDYFYLSKLIDLALAEPRFNLSRNTKRALPHLRDVGHLSAHGRYYLAAPEDIEGIRHDCRVVLEEFLHHAGLI